MRWLLALTLLGLLVAACGNQNRPIRGEIVGLDVRPLPEGPGFSLNEHAPEWEKLKPFLPSPVPKPLESR